jgi:hypothetical protein
MGHWASGGERRGVEKSVSEPYSHRMFIISSLFSPFQYIYNIHYMSINFLAKKFGYSNTLNIAGPAPGCKWHTGTRRERKG